MSGDDWARLLYFAILLVAIGGWVWASARRDISRALQQLLIWLMIFLGLVSLYGLRDTLDRQLFVGSRVETEGNRIVITRAPDGHFYLPLEIDGVKVRFLVDTGASNIVLAARDAERIGIDTARLVPVGEAMTANGPVAIAPVTLRNVRLAGHEIGRVRAFVSEGEMDVSLLGMDFLRRFGRISIEGNRMVLEF